MGDALYLFIDFDDTLSDFGLLGEQFVSELARRLARDFGADSTTWAAALKPELEASIARYADRFTGDPLAGFRAWIAEERPRVVAAVFERAETAVPTKEPLATLGERLQSESLVVCDATFTGAKDCLQELSDAGVRIQMASSQESQYLAAALSGTGIESLVEHHFGPDLLDCAKEGTEYYRRAFELCGIRPSQAIVVDDQAQCLDWAEEAGARVVQACVKPDPADPEFPVVLRSLRDLPRLIRMGLA